MKSYSIVLIPLALLAMLWGMVTYHLSRIPVPISQLETNEPEQLRTYLRDCLDRPHHYPSVQIKTSSYLATCNKEKAHVPDAP